MTASPSGSSGAGAWIGRELGSRTATWTESDAILFALAVGARPDTSRDLVDEEHLRVLPTFGLTLAQWAPDLLGEAGAFEVGRAVHGSQKLTVHAPLPPAGKLDLAARVAAVWDKGSAAVFDVEVSSECFDATWSIFAPGSGGFGGERGPSRAGADLGTPTSTYDLPIAANAAALYRLLGDRHRIHIDPDAAKAIGQPRPILHGLATLSSAVLVIAEAAQLHPADLTHLEGRFTSVVFPGETATVETWSGGAFDVRTSRGVALADGQVHFAQARA